MDVQGWVVAGIALLLFGYLVPHLAYSRQQLADSRVEDRFSATLRVVTTGATARRSPTGEHHGAPGSRPYLHEPRRRTEAPVVNRPTTASERAATEARRLAAARATRAAEISRRRAAARRRLVLTVVLLLATVGGWLGAGLTSLSIAAGIVPTVLLGAVLVLGRRAAKAAARRNAADRASIMRLDPRAAPSTGSAAGRPASGRPGTARPAAGATMAQPTAATRVTATASGATAVSGALASETEPAGGATAATRTRTNPATATSGATAVPRATTSEYEGAEASGTAGGTAALAPMREQGETEVSGTATGATAVAAGASTSAPPATSAPDAGTEPGVAVDGSDEASVTAEKSGSSKMTWTPVAVPAPAYTLKAPAPRRDVVPYASPAAEETTPAAGPEPGPVAEPQPGSVTEAQPVFSGLAGSPYAPVADAEPVAAPVAAARPTQQGMDLDSVLARRRALGA